MILAYNCSINPVACIPLTLRISCHIDCAEPKSLRTDNSGRRLIKKVHWREEKEGICKPGGKLNLFCYPLGTLASKNPEVYNETQ